MFGLLLRDIAVYPWLMVRATDTTIHKIPTVLSLLKNALVPKMPRKAIPRMDMILKDDKSRDNSESFSASGEVKRKYPLIISNNFFIIFYENYQKPNQ